MGITTKFYFYFLVIVALSPILVSEIVLVYQSFNGLDVILLALILLVYLGLYLAIRKDFLLPFNELQKWVNDYNIDQAARLNDEKKTTFQPVATAINHL
ncbi:MAG: histidine kinase, partial [Candidatus Thioglobus sp.]